MQEAAHTPGLTAGAEQPCPKCKAHIPVYQGFVTWCDQCGWNLRPYIPEKPRTLIDSTYEALGKRFGRGLVEQLVRAADLKPRLTPAKALAYSFAVLVHGLTALVALLGLALIILGWPHIILVVWGLIMLAVAYALLPRRGKLYEKEDVADRAEFPTLYRLVDQVAAALHTRPVDVIVLDEDFNAGFAQIGWRRRRILALGLPLFSILSGPERIALLGHELAHGVNGDPSRGLIVGSAITSLLRWYYLVRPEHLLGQARGSILMLPANVVLLGLSYIVKLMALLLLHLSWQASQRAEYLADALGAQISGTSAALGTLDKLHLGGICAMTVRRVMLTPRQQRGDLFADLRRDVARVPERELERIRRIEHLAGSRLDSTHPPTVYRLQLLEAHPVAHPAVTWSAADEEALARELAPAQARIQSRVLDLFERNLYY